MTLVSTNFHFSNRHNGQWQPGNTARTEIIRLYILVILQFPFFRYSAPIKSCTSIQAHE